MKNAITASAYSDKEIIAKIQSSKGRVSTNELKTTLWFRYENQVHKHWAILRRQLSNSSMILEMEHDFYSEAYVAFTKAIGAIDLKKIRDEKWRFVGYFKYYLTNVRTEFITKLVRQYHAERPFYVETEDGSIPRIELSVQDTYEHTMYSPEQILERKLEEQRVSTAVHHCMAHWDEKRRSIFKLRQQGLAKGEVAVKLKVHPATITYHLQAMKQDLQKELRSLEC